VNLQVNFVMISLVSDYYYYYYYDLGQILIKKRFPYNSHLIPIIVVVVVVYAHCHDGVYGNVQQIAGFVLE